MSIPFIPDWQPNTTYCGLTSVDVKAAASTFDKDKALVWAYSVIVKFLFSRRFVSSSTCHPVIGNLVQRLHSLDKCNAVSTIEISGGTILFRAVPHSSTVCTVSDADQGCFIQFAYIQNRYRVLRYRVEPVVLTPYHNVKLS